MFKFRGKVHDFALFGPRELHKLQTKCHQLNLGYDWIEHKISKLSVHTHTNYAFYLNEVIIKAAA